MGVHYTMFDVRNKELVELDIENKLPYKLSTDYQKD